MWQWHGKSWEKKKENLFCFRRLFVVYDRRGEAIVLEVIYVVYEQVDI